MQLKKGDKVGAYVLSDQLGGGGNGVVWRAQTASGQVAVKILRKVKEKAYARFHAEIEALTRLGDFQGIVPILGSFLPKERSAEKPPWYVMPIARPSLEAIENFDAKEIILEFVRLADSLQALHDQKIAHRDIKPANLLIYKDHFCFSDFGLVQFPGRTQGLTEKAEAVGPKSTIAPEMRRDPLRSDPFKADIYSFAKTLWIFLTKEKNGFEGQYSADSSLGLHARTDISAVDILDEILRSATETDPNRRPSVSEISKKLNEWLRLVADYDAVVRHEWKVLAKEIFPAGVPDHARWAGGSEILEVLTAVAKRGRINHCFLPDGGGMDLIGVKNGNEKGGVELDLDGYPTLMRPKTLDFVQIDRDPQWTYFRLEADELDATGLSKNISTCEEVVELSPGKYIHAAFHDLQEFNGEPLPPQARRIQRYLKGVFLFVHKASAYNKSAETYDGRHNNMTADKFRIYMERNRRRASNGIAEVTLGVKQESNNDFTAIEAAIPKVVAFKNGESAFKALTIPIVVHIISLAEQYGAAKRGGDRPGFVDLHELRHLVEKGPVNPLYAELKKLDKAQLKELTALMWFGRGYAPSISNWKGALRDADRDVSADAERVRYVGGKGEYLADYLRDGLNKLGLT